MVCERVRSAGVSALERGETADSGSDGRMHATLGNRGKGWVHLIFPKVLSSPHTLDYH